MCRRRRPSQWQRSVGRPSAARTSPRGKPKLPAQIGPRPARMRRISPGFLDERTSARGSQSRQKTSRIGATPSRHARPPIRRPEPPRTEPMTQSGARNGPSTTRTPRHSAADVALGASPEHVSTLSNTFWVESSDDAREARPGPSNPSRECVAWPRSDRRCIPAPRAATRPISPVLTTVSVVRAAPRGAPPGPGDP